MEKLVICKDCGREYDLNVENKDNGERCDLCADARQAWLKMNKPMNVLEEVKNDMNMIREKILNVKGYRIVTELLDLVPYNLRSEFTLDDNSVLYMGFERLTKLSNIVEIIDDYDEDLKTNLEKCITIARRKGEFINIYFKYEKDEDTKRINCIGYKVVRE